METDEASIVISSDFGLNLTPC